VHAKSTPGFIVNRVARPYYAEALRLCEEQVADPATLDALLTEGAGFRMGPFALMAVAEIRAWAQCHTGAALGGSFAEPARQGLRRPTGLTRGRTR
jgi:3-hydroxyacyl-CoA dehydrogenase